MYNNLKANNLGNVASSLFLSTNKTKLQLSNLTSLSNTTISDAINGMLKIGFVKVVGYEDSAGGRKSAIYSIDEDYGQTIGVEINKKRIVGTITDMHGDVLYSKETDVNKKEKIINQLIDFLHSLRENKLCSNPIAIGISLDGKIDNNNQIVIECEELNWNNVHLKEIVERRLSIPTYIDHSVNSLIFMEMVKWKSIKNNDFMIVLDDKEVKCSLYVDENIVRGKDNYFGKSSLVSYKEIFSIAKFMDIRDVIICNLNGKKRDGLKTSDSLDINLVMMKLSEGDVSTGMALQAEAQWFKSIYFLLG